MAGFRTMALVHELSARLEHEGLGDYDADLGVAQTLADRLRPVLDHHGNRLSPTYLQAVFQRLYGKVAHLLPPLRGARVVELGCGSWAPMNLGMALLALGADTATGVDLDYPRDVPRAIQALADVVVWLLTSPERMLGARAVSRAEILANVASFDLAGMAAGSVEAVDHRRIRLLPESAAAMRSLADGEMDLLVSNSFLEHVEDLDAVLAEMRRVVRIGGCLSHGIDATDHRRYGNPGVGELDFLDEPAAGMVGGTNRLRPAEFLPRFREHGFVSLLFTPFHRSPLTDARIAAFVEPFRSMPREQLEVTMAHVVLRRVE